MLTIARGGRLAAGSGACIFSLCLLSTIGLSQTNVVVPEPVEGTDATSAWWRQIQEQHQAVLEAIEEVQHTAEVTLDVHRERVLTELDALKRDLVSRREQDLDVMRRLHDDTRTVTLATGGIAVFVLLLNALILFWGMNGVAARLGAIFNLHPSRPVNTDTIKEIDPPLALDNPVAQTRIVQIIERLDKRLLELETRTIQKGSHAAADAKSRISPMQGGQPATGPGKAPRVFITLGEGSAIGFLPPAVGALKLRAWWSRVQWWKRDVKRPRAS